MDAAAHSAKGPAAGASRPKPAVSPSPPSDGYYFKTANGKVCGPLSNDKWDWCQRKGLLRPGMKAWRQQGYARCLASTRVSPRNSSRVHPDQSSVVLQRRGLYFEDFAAHHVVKALELLAVRVVV
jgi:hypothetical protein